MQPKTRRAVCLSAALAALFISASLALAQEDPTPKKKLRSPATVKDSIGGEAHDNYVIHDYRLSVRVK